jgi:hypothetical protein
MLYHSAIHRIIHTKVSRCSNLTNDRVHATAEFRSTPPYGIAFYISIETISALRSLTITSWSELWPYDSTNDLSAVWPAR